MVRAILAVMVGFAIWSAVWLGGNVGFKAAMPAAYSGGDLPTQAGVLLGILVLSVICSLAAGLVAARLKGTRTAATVIVLGVILLAVGIPIQLSVWDKMPAWYHLSFLVLLIPATVAGGRMVPQRLA